MSDRFIESPSAGEIVTIISVAGENTAGDIGAKSGVTINIDRFVFGNQIQMVTECFEGSSEIL